MYICIYVYLQTLDNIGLVVHINNSGIHIQYPGITKSTHSRITIIMR